MRRQSSWPLIVLLFVCTFWLPPPIEAAGKGEPGPVHATRIELVDRQADLDLFHKLDLDVDGVFDGWVRVHLVQDEIDKLRRMGFRVTVLPPEPALGLLGPEGAAAAAVSAIPSSYHTYETLTAELQAIADTHPDLVRLFTIGRSVQGRELWMLKISADPEIETDEPEMAYVAAMHGDEVVGKELLIALIHHLLDNYGIDSRITALVDGAEIWIMPSMNPDGTELDQRYNANGYDLNRNFPDWFSDPVNTTSGRQPETAAVMGWVAERSIDLSANFHGGALVANYPWDNNEQGASVFSPTPDPDQDALHSISLTYAENNTPMYSSPSFPQGVTNGAEWYAIDGGLQDWSYAWYGKWDVTMEISDVKWPPANQRPTFWDDNRESMLAYLERALEGLRGVVTDAATGAPVAAEVRLDANPFPAYTDPDVGDYHRIVLPGTYTVEVSAPGYYPQTAQVEVVGGAATRHDVALQSLPADLQPVSGRIEDGPGGNGLLDPGEMVDLAVTLKNLGRLATTVSGRLVPTGWYGDVLQADAGYPDIDNQETGESQPPYYVVQVDPDVPDGHKIGLAVQWSADQGGGVSEPLFLDVGEAACGSADALDVPQSINDYQTTTSQLKVNTGPVIDEVRVSVEIAHTYIGDLVLTLTSPSGTEVVLHDRSGGGANDIVGTYGVDLTSAEPLSALTDEPSAGDWTLTVADNAGGDTGSLVSWSVEACGYAVEAEPPEMRLRELTVEPEGVLLTWWPYPGIQSYKIYRSADPGSSAAFADVTAEDGDPTDTSFADTSADPLACFIVTGVGSQGEGPRGHFGE
jgi:carboxypeptidase D